jgi:signal transduction histidine kinase
MLLLWHNPAVIRPQDVVWLLLFGALAAISPSRDPSEMVLFAGLAAAQIAESKFKARGPFDPVFWIGVKLGLGYLLIGYTGGLSSRYWLVLLFPVVSAATAFGVIGTLLCALAASGAYLSFLLYIDWTRWVIGPTEAAELVMRLVFLAMIGTLANSLAEALRVQSKRSQAVAEELAEANRHLQAAQAEMQRSQRLAALGQLSAGLAHELRNPLGTIRGSAELLRGNLSEENAVAREMSEFIVSEADRTNALVTQFLDFARPMQLRLEAAELAPVVDRAITQAQRETRASGVEVYKNYDPAIPRVAMDAAYMERVFYNLVLNAIQATPPGGAVTVKTRATASGTVEVDVIDRGAGIAPANLEQIFNPFFTTKPEGVGLGLAIVSKIVDEHGGRIAVESEPSRGAVFRVAIPLRGAAAKGQS